MQVDDFAHTFAADDGRNAGEDVAESVVPFEVCAHGNDATFVVKDSTCYCDSRRGYTIVRESFFVDHFWTGYLYLLEDAFVCVVSKTIGIVCLDGVHRLASHAGNAPRDELCGAMLSDNIGIDAVWIDVDDFAKDTLESSCVERRAAADYAIAGQSR